MPWYFINPRAAKGNAPKTHIQLTVSVPNNPCKPKYMPMATPTARTIE
jgi:hypothetical protein